MSEHNHQELVSLIWNTAETLRGDYKQSDYGKVVLPFIVLRRLDCVLEPTKQAVLDALEKVPDGCDDEMKDEMLNDAAKQSFHNASKFNFEKLKGDPNSLAENLNYYINSFSENVRSIFIDYFEFPKQITRLDKGNLLFLVLEKFAEIDLHPDKVDNHGMGYIFEELIRKFSEQSNETAGEHFTPREVIRLMVDLLFAEDDKVLAAGHPIVTVYDPACGTGGMLALTEDHLNKYNENATVVVHGQELNPESYAMCKSDMLIKGQKVENIKFGNSFDNDQLSDEKFDYMLSNPPFGVEWKKVKEFVENEHENMGMAGRFGAGLPRISDGSLLFLQHMISKMKPVDPKTGKGGSKIGIVFNGSPLFSGSAGKAESNIRKWIIENDMLEAIIGLPDRMFYNTGIHTYVWILSNKKESQRKGKIQLIDARDKFVHLRRNLGDKGKEISPEQISEITKFYCEFKESAASKIFENHEFGFHRVTIEQPLRLRFQKNEETLSRFQSESAFKNLAKSKKKNEAEREAEITEGKRIQSQIIEALLSMRDEVYMKKEEFIRELDRACNESNVKLSSSLKTAIIKSFSERDAEAEVCRDKRGNLESDPDLRDNENIPLKENIEDYFAKEVSPNVPDAWIDDSKTVIGYEIPFTKIFYNYVPPRKLEEIETDIKEIDTKISTLLKEVLA